ncbi:hypothetical protein [Pedobacter sp. L105]|uniref:hypothetical protein n=1 Tax=Pedobacter sp. L105 TaxID=1641871 RepID=UPI00131C03DC|nr:hypothetical protein [Pedobacter sp. L105]
MKYKTIKLTKFTLLLFAVSMGLYSCKKDGATDNKAVVPVSSVGQVNEQNVLKYLSITLGVSPSEIKFDPSDNDYVVRGLKLNKDTVYSQYSRANEYKLNFEKK